MKTIVTINVEIDPGYSILEAFNETIRLATELNVKIQFKFNDVVCIAYPNDDPEKGQASYFKATANGLNIAFSS